MDLYIKIYENYLDFYPTSKMTAKEKILSLIRFFIYLSIIGIIFFRSLIIVSIIILVILYFVYENIEESINICYRPSLSNPAMNITYTEMLMEDKPNACDMNDEKVMREYRDKLGYNLYENEKDIFFSKNQERLFYAQPVREIINDQNKYLGNLYGKSLIVSCKQDRYNCLPHELDLSMRDKK
jgi:hypothetical protein